MDARFSILLTNGTNTHIPTKQRYIIAICTFDKTT